MRIFNANPYKFLSVNLLGIISFACIAQARVSDELLVLYNFGEGSGAYVHDISETGTPLMLLIQDSDHVQWIEGGGLAINNPTIIKSLVPATKINEACMATNALTLEAWIAPDNVSQDGPARIMSVSHGSSVRNATLGQIDDTYIARVRTENNSDNGLPNFVSGVEGALSTSLQHVVYTLADEVESFYIDGELVSTGTRSGGFDDWNDAYPFAIGNEIGADRDWLGTIFLSAAYGTALSPEQVQQNFEAGHLVKGPSYSTELCDEEDCFVDGFGADARVLWMPDLPNGVHHKFKFDENGGHLDRYDDGTAHLYGGTVNMLDPTIGFYVDVWWTEKKNWDQWSALGRGWKGDPAIVGDNYLDWDYYIMDEDLENVLVCTGDWEGQLDLTHKPADYYYGFQIGVAANDQNELPGMSCWFDYTGYIDGSYVDGNGDINMEGECVNLPVLECVVDIEVSCDSGYEPEITGTPTVNCPVEYTLTYWDEVLSAECPLDVIRHWEATSTTGELVSCEQYITSNDLDPPQIFVSSAILYDCEEVAEAQIHVFDLCDSDPSYSVSQLDSLWAGDEDCDAGQLRTQTMGGWGAEPSGNNPGTYLHANFDAAFPEGLTIGCGDNTLTLTSAQAVTDFLPSGSTATTLPDGGMVDPGNGYNNVLAGQLVALTLSTTFDNYDPDFGFSEWVLEDLYLQTGDLAGLTLGQLLINANLAIGGCVETDLSVINDALSTSNENYVDGDTNEGNIDCELPWDCYFQHLFEVTVTDNCGNTTTQIVSTYYVDITPPQVPELEEFITVSCDSIPDPEIPEIEGCGDDVFSITVEDEVFSGGCLPTIQRTWFFGDQCANDTTFVQYITVIDEEAPVFVSEPEDVTVGCDEDIPPFDPEVTDNCDDDIEVIFTEEVAENDCGQTITQVWTASDECGNSASVSRTITVTDSQAPTPTTILEDVTVSCDMIPMPEEVDFVDECSSVEIFFEQEQTGSGCSYTLNRTWTAIDGCGNTAVFTQQITVTDEEPPFFSNVPEDIVLECGSELPTDMPEAMDLCSGVSVEEFLQFIEDSGCGAWVKTWIATDDCGNSASVSQNIVFEDTEAPVILGVPEDFIGSCGDVLETVVVTAEDNCDEAVEVLLDETTEATECGVILTRTWTAQDACGNTAIDVQILNLTDQTPPEIIADSEIIIDCMSVDSDELIEAIDDCSGEIIVSYEDNVIGEGCDYDIERLWTATDVCGNTTQFAQLIHVTDQEAPEFIDPPEDLVLECTDDAPPVAEVTVNDCGSVELTFTEGWLSEGCSVQMIRTWVAADNCGNQSSIIQTISFIDDQPPVISNVPPNVTLGCLDPIPNPAMVSVEDNCDSDPFVEFTETTVAGHCDATFDIIRTWTATDECGNSSLAQQIISVVDDTAPVFDQALTDIVVDCGDIPEPPAITASDACGGLVSVVLEVVTDAGGCPNFTNIWTATDECGNEAIMTQSVQVDDNEPPLLLGIPDDVDVDCNSIPDMPEPEVSDNCDDNVDVSVNENIIGSGCEFTIIRTWIASDDCGNTTIESQSINVVDEAPPVFVSAPEDITVDCQEVDQITFPNVVDDCEGTVQLFYDDQVLGEGCEYDILRTYTAIDLCGNVASATQNIHVVDMTPPTISGVGPNMYVSCDEIPDPEMALATDACSEVVSVEFSEFPIGEGCSYMLNRSWTATDACGNTASIVQLIYVADEQAPLFVDVEPDLELSCGSEIPEPVEPTVSDNCSDGLTINFIEFTESSSCGDIITRTWTATDDCGNTGSATQMISLVDNEPPVIFDVPADETATCDNLPEIGIVSTFDFCSEVVVLVEEYIEEGDCPYEIVRVWTATDMCGNSATASQSVFVVDDVPPTLSNLPEDMIVGCGQIPDPQLVEADDDCHGEIQAIMAETWDEGECVSFLYRTWTATDHCGNMAVHTQTIEVRDEEAPVFESAPEDLYITCEDLEPMEFINAMDDCGSVMIEMTEDTIQAHCASEYEMYRTWIATDNCDNLTTMTQLIEVVDTIAPTLSDFPEDITVSCAEVPEVPEIITEDQCGNDVELNFVEEIEFLEEESDDCQLGNATSLSGDVAIWLPDLSGFGSDFVFGEEGGLLQRDLDNGTAHLTGQVYDAEDPNFSWIVDIYLYDQMGWEQWSENGGWYKDDLELAGDNYLDWDYYKLSDESRLIGSGYFEGSELMLSHAPSDFTFGFQLGQAANNTNDAYGMSGWFYYDGDVMGTPVSGTGDVITENNCCPDHIITRTWTATDCVGNSITWTQVITVESEFDIEPVIIPNGPELMTAYVVGEEIVVELFSEEDTDVTLSFTDINGKVIWGNQIVQLESHRARKVTINTYEATGCYLVNCVSGLKMESVVVVMSEGE